MTALSPAYLAPDWRYSGDDWSGSNALTYTVYSVAPTYNTDGTVLTAGTPMNLTGHTVSGTLVQQGGNGLPCLQNVALLVPIGAVVDAVNGLMSLSLPKAATAFPRQSLSDWGDVRNALLFVIPKVIDSAMNRVTVGIQPLFVF